MLSAVVLGCSPLATGCLVAEAPDYGPPQQRPPVVDVTKVRPSPYELQVVDEGRVSFEIDVPVRSEDAGDPLQGVLWMDYKLPQQDDFDEKQVPASSFDDLERAFSTTWVWDERVRERCGHTLTLLLMHRSNYNDDENIPNENAEWDVASVTWQLNVFPDPNKPDVIEICPSPPASVPSAP